MIEEFIIRLEDGREIKIADELLKEKLEEDAVKELAKALKTETLEGLLLKMSNRIANAKRKDADN